MWYLGGDFRVGNLLDTEVRERRIKDDSALVSGLGDKVAGASFTEK